MSKRTPMRGERSITHITSNTGASETFALAPDNFDPAIIEKLRGEIASLPEGADMIERGELAVILHSPRYFSVIAEAWTISHNTVTLTEDGLLLTTTLDRDAPQVEGEILAMAADCEQCIAIALSDFDLAAGVKSV